MSVRRYNALNLVRQGRRGQRDWAPAWRLPDPKPLRFPVEQFKSAKPVLVGASRLELAAARAAGVPMWAVPYGYDSAVAEAGPDRMIPGVGALVDALASPSPQRRAA